jgi:hypothetical protein
LQGPVPVGCNRDFVYDFFHRLASFSAEIACAEL